MTDIFTVVAVLLIVGLLIVLAIVFALLKRSEYFRKYYENQCDALTNENNSLLKSVGNIHDLNVRLGRFNVLQQNINQVHELTGKLIIDIKKGE